MIKPVLFALLSLTLLGQASAAEQIRVCQDDVEVFPWVMKSGQGMSAFMLREVGRRTGIEIIIESMPWKRCLATVQNGQIDGAVAASFTPERMAIGSYPMNSLKKIDTQRRMSDEAYALFILKDNAAQISWNGKQLGNIEKPVAAQLGYSAVNILKAMNLPVDDSDKRPELLLRKLLLGSVSAALLNERQGEWLLKDPIFGDHIIALEPAVTRREGYLLISHAYARKHPHLAERIWNEIALVRESALYQHELLNALNAAP